MSIIKDTFFGGAEKKAAKAVVQSNKEAQQILKENMAEAKGEAIPLFQGAEKNLLGGFQGALDVFGQSLPAQTQAFRQGNVNAQQQLLAGMPQFQNALMGNQVDYRAFQPQSVDTSNLGFFQQQLPQFQTMEQSLNLNKPQVQQQVHQPRFDARSMLGGGGAGDFRGRMGSVR